MKTLKSIKIALSLTIALSASAWGYGTGVISYPLQMEKRLVSAEFTGITSTGGGVGLQGRYTQRLGKKLTLDAGLGMSGGERSGRIFAGADYEIFPDYMKQPKVSVKTQLENAKEFDSRRNILSLAPTISKGFSFWGKEAYPFASLPYAISLDSESKTYQTSVNLALGMAGHIPVEGYRHLVGTIEGTIGIKDSYTGVFMGVSYPIN